MGACDDLILRTLFLDALKVCREGEQSLWCRDHLAHGGGPLDGGALDDFLELGHAAHLVSARIAVDLCHHVRSGEGATIALRYHRQIGGGDGKAACAGTVPLGGAAMATGAMFVKKLCAAFLWRINHASGTGGYGEK